MLNVLKTTLIEFYKDGVWPDRKALVTKALQLADVLEIDIEGMSTSWALCLLEVWDAVRPDARIKFLGALTEQCNHAVGFASAKLAVDAFMSYEAPGYSCNVLNRIGDELFVVYVWHNSGASCGFLK